MAIPTQFAAKAAMTLALIALTSCTSAIPQARTPNTLVPASGAAPAAAPNTSGRKTIDGIDYYYEVHGTGAPLLMLHGGLGSIDMFGPGPSRTRAWPKP